MNRLAPIAQVFTHFSNDLRKFLQVILDEVYLGVVILLNTIESIAVLISDLINMIINELDMAFILLLGLVRRKLRVTYLLLKDRKRYF